MVKMFLGKLLKPRATPQQEALAQKAKRLLAAARKRKSLKRRAALEARAMDLIRRANEKADN